MKKETLARRCCGTCGKYFPIVAAKNQHLAAHVAMPHDDTESQGFIEDDEESADLGLYEHGPVFEIMREPFIHGSGILPFLYLLLMYVFFFDLYCNKLSLLFLCKMCLCKFILSIYLVFRTYISYVTEMYDITGWGGCLLKSEEV